MCDTMHLQKQVNGDVWYIYNGNRVAVNPWPSKPDRRNKWVMFNCLRYRAQWLQDATR